MTQKNLKIQEYYEIGPVVGQGTTSELRIGILKSNRVKRIIKIMELDRFSDEQLKLLIANINKMKEFNHPNLPKLYDYYRDQFKLYVVFEYIDGTELFDHIIFIKQNSEKVAAGIIKQILSAIQYCHERGITHLDLKPENLILDHNNNNRMVLIDMGMNDFLDKDRFFKVKNGAVIKLYSLT